MNTINRFIFIAITLMTTAITAATQNQTTLLPEYSGLIKTLVANPQVQEAFDFIERNDAQTLEDHIALTEIHGAPFKEDIRAKAFKKMLIAEGIDSIWIDAVGNVVGVRNGKNSKKTIGFDAHLDTVFPEETDVKVKVKGDTLYAPGIGDNTRGLALLITVLRTMETLNIETEHDVLFIGTVGEEGLGDLRGVKELFKEGSKKIDSWIAIDGGDLARVINKGLGSYRYRVTFKGPGGHSWGAFGMVNPHHALGSGIKYFVDAADKYTSTGPRTSYNVGRIGGGTSINSVPFESWMEVDMRSIQAERLDTMEEILYKAVNQAVKDQNTMKRRGADMSVVIDKIGFRPSGSLPSTTPIIQKAMAATAYMGKRPNLSRGSTNSNTPISMGIPSVTLGRGGVGANAHALDEYWINKQGYKAIQRALLVLLSEAGIAE